MAENKVSYGGFNLIYIRCRSPPLLRSFHLERLLCPIFFGGGGGATLPLKPATIAIKNMALGFPGTLFFVFPKQKKQPCEKSPPSRLPCGWNGKQSAWQQESYGQQHLDASSRRAEKKSPRGARFWCLRCRPVIKAGQISGLISPSYNI